VRDACRISVGAERPSGSSRHGVGSRLVSPTQLGAYVREQFDLIRCSVDGPQDQRVESVADEPGERLDPEPDGPTQRLAGQVADR
jgi:hypothetical protein